MLINTLLEIVLKGGAGSGNWGHVGRLGKVGGSYSGIGGLHTIGLKRTDSKEVRKIISDALKERRKELMPSITALAEEFGYDPKKIKFAGQPYEFRVGNDNYTAAGDYNPRTGVIRLFPGILVDPVAVKPEVNRAMLAHEINHDKYKKYRDAYLEQDAELSSIYSSEVSRGVPYRERILTANGDVRDPKNYKRFSAYMLDQKILKYCSPEVDLKDRIDETIGGVSPYSNSYWEKFRQGRNPNNIDAAVNETFAEIARLKATSPSVVIHPVWEELYNDFINL